MPQEVEERVLLHTSVRYCLVYFSIVDKCSSLGTRPLHSGIVWYQDMGLVL